VRVEDIDWGEGALRVVGKGDKERRIYLKPVIMKVLRDYIRDVKRTGFLFPGSSGRPVTGHTMRERFRRYVRAAGLTKRVTPHSLRHSIAVHYLMGGAPLSFVQEFLGHTSLAATGIYTQLTDPMLKEVVLRIPTALDLVAARQQGSEVQDSRGEYQADVEYWEDYVCNVLEWPSRSHR
jgi:integrase/recombinase XerD